VIAAAIPDAMLLPTDECFAQEVPEPVYDGLTCPNMLYEIQIRAHDWTRNRSHGFALEVGGEEVSDEEHPANCPLRWRLSNGLGVYLS
jgi:hypothetical protein